MLAAPALGPAAALIKTNNGRLTDKHSACVTKRGAIGASDLTRAHLVPPRPRSNVRVRLCYVTGNARGLITVYCTRAHLSTELGEAG